MNHINKKNVGIVVFLLILAVALAFAYKKSELIFSCENAPCVQDILSQTLPNLANVTSTIGASCMLDGVTVKHGETVMFYRKNSIPVTWDQSCTDYGIKRTCQNGVLSNGQPYKITGEYFNKAKCTVDTVQPTLKEASKSKKWTLVFHDEFARKKNVWTYDNGPMWLGGYRVPENAVVATGTLRIMTKLGTRTPTPEKEVNGVTISSSRWESANMTTKEDFTYGLFEARLKFNKAESIDNAFWLMMSPLGPEIDVVEGFYWKDAQDVITSTLHVRNPKSNDHVMPAIGKKIPVDVDLSAAYHTYSVEWNEKEIIWYFDGKETFRVTDPKVLAYYKNQPLRMRLSTAVSNFFSKNGVPTSANGESMVVDYVRVFKEVK